MSDLITDMTQDQYFDRMEKVLNGSGLSGGGRFADTGDGSGGTSGSSSSSNDWKKKLLTASEKFLLASNSILKSVQDNASGVDVATQTLVTSINAGAGGFSKVLGGLGDTLQTFGSGLAALAPTLQTKLLGGALVVAGGATKIAGELSKVSADTLVKSLEMMSKEARKQIEAYHTMAGAGALYTKGMGEMMEYSTAAGLSIKTFSEIVKSNTDTMYRSGMTIADASKKISDTFASADKSGKKLKESLLNLGYNLNEQGALVAETMQYLKIAGTNVRAMSGGQIADATREYAINLKTIAAITGDDAKKKMEQAREASANAAVQAKLAAMSPDEQKKFKEGLATVPEEMRNAVLQFKLLGVVTDRSTNILMASTPGLRDSIEGMASGLEKGSEAVGIYREKMNQQLIDSAKTGSMNAVMGILPLVGAAGAATDAMGLFTKSLLETQKGANTPGDTARIAADAKAMADINESVDKITTNLHKTVVQGEQMTSILENEATKYLDEYTKALVGINVELGKTIRGMTSLTAIFATAGAKTVTSMAQFVDWSNNKPDANTTPGPATVDSGPAGVFGDLGKNRSHAVGGIAQGPKSGYLDQLHGNELIVPLEGGKLDETSVGYSELLKLLKTPTVGESSVAKQIQPGAFTAKPLDINLDASSISKTLEEIPFEKISASAFPLIDIFRQLTTFPLNKLSTDISTLPWKEIKEGINALPFPQLASGLLSFISPITMVSSSLVNYATSQDTHSRQLELSSKDLASMTAEERHKFQQGLASVPAELQKAVFEQLTLGTVIDKNTNLLMASMPNLSDSIKAMASNLSGGSASIANFTTAVGNAHDNFKGVPDFSGIIDDVSTSTATQQSKITTALDLINKAIQALAQQQQQTPQNDMADKKSSQTLLAEIKKMTDLLSQQNSMSEEAMKMSKQLVDVANDHKNISRDIFRNTVS
jgi:hypothetical protein